jgi:hypothetical protein
MVMGRWGGAAAIAAGVLCAGAAAAEPGLANKVYAPYVRNGLTEVEVRGGRFTGGAANGESALVVELERGISDRISLAVLAEFEDHPGEARKLDAVAVEGVVYIGQIPGLGVDVGGYLEYEQRIHNESGAAEAKLLLARRAGPFEGLLNLIAVQPLTDRDGEGAMEFGYAAQGTMRAARGLKLGVQAFGDLGTNRSFGGRQAHFVGPMANWEIRPAWLKGGELEFEVAYLAAVGPARDDTDGQLRLTVEWERRF